MYAPTVLYLSYDAKKWCLEEINMLLVWSVCGTIYKLNSENVIKSFFITNGNMQLAGGDKQWMLICHLIYICFCMGNLQFCIS